MNFFQRILHKPFFIRLFHWEYWSMDAIYFPFIYPVYAWLVIRGGFKYFFVAANPLIRYGGFLMESKKEIYDQLPEGLYPKTLFFHAGTTAATVLVEIRKHLLSFPLVAKPDIGQRGLAVKKLENEKDVEFIAEKYKVDFLIQEFIPFENEAGIFYYRYPGQEKGKISGIVGKEFLTVSGDGEKTLLEILYSDKRYVLQIDSLRKEYKNELNIILKPGEKRLLVPYGNHARGAKFLDHSYKTDSELENLIDSLLKKVPEFYYGRMDIRYSTWEELKQGKNFSIIELNGSGSEPTHIYDPKHSLFFAWKEIIRHCIILWRISILNQKRGFRFMSFNEGARMFLSNREHRKKLKEVHQSLLFS